MECCRRPDRTTADRTETHGTHQQGASGSFSADASSSVSSLPFGSIIFSRCPRRNNQTVSHTGFGSGSGGLSAVSENFWARKKRLIYQSLFHWVNPIKTPGYAGGISKLQLQAKTSYAIIILSPPRHKEA